MLGDRIVSKYGAEHRESAHTLHAKLLTRNGPAHGVQTLCGLNLVLADSKRPKPEEMSKTICAICAVQYARMIDIERTRDALYPE